ncbi:hypothetical protein SAY87_006182 [Trapa incisa]|uniref:protein-serine/threonine phosphatase n=1 Tax=Trapa incisa TaxID=236973 RepID=A0AAN7K7A4_9MYRT|nr:hypothetical protein SAY87_006182 [Trapa incisa]
MANIWNVDENEIEAAAPVEPTSEEKVLEKLYPLVFKLVADATAVSTGWKKRKCETFLIPRDGSISKKECVDLTEFVEDTSLPVKGSEALPLDELMDQKRSSKEPMEQALLKEQQPKFGFTSICGKRRDMEDTVSVQPWLCIESPQYQGGLHLFGIFDGHGCSHVAMRCKNRLHEIVEEEIWRSGDEHHIEWKEMMENIFIKMDREVDEWSESVKCLNCRYKNREWRRYSIGSTATVALVTQDKIIVSNCGDSRAVLCRNGVAIALSSDHKPQRPDELRRIQNAGGKVVYWDGPRVMGVLAMSRAIGDICLRPYVIPNPEVTVTDRVAGDQFLILASDGLWDVVSNEMACRVARMCLNSQEPPPSPTQPPGSSVVLEPTDDISDDACSDASVLLTKLALARCSTDNISVIVIDLSEEAGC